MDRLIEKSARLNENIQYLQRFLFVFYVFITPNSGRAQNVLSDGWISLYLEYYLGREETPVLDDNGNPVLYETGKMVGKPKVHTKHNRRKENLQLYLIVKSRTPIERQQNKETLELATKIRAEREQQFKESMLGYRLKKDRNINFLDLLPSVHRQLYQQRPANDKNSLESF